MNGPLKTKAQEEDTEIFIQKGEATSPKLDICGICIVDPPFLMSTIRCKCQGLGLPWKVQFLQDVIRQEKPTCTVLCETISNKKKMVEIQSKLGFESMIVVKPVGRSGGLAMLWNESDQANFISLSQNHIDVEIKVTGIILGDLQDSMASQ